MTDLDFISGEFLDCEIAKDKRWLLRYFVTDVQVAFLRYYSMFGEHKNFVDHTGWYCSRRMRFKMQEKYLRLTETHGRAKNSLTEEGMRMLQKLETGKLRLTQLP